MAQANALTSFGGDLDITAPYNISEELQDVPLYFSLHEVCKTVHCSPPRAEVFKSALLNAGVHRWLWFWLYCL